MDWEPISEASLWDKINAAETRMNPQQARLWEAIRIAPHKWEEESYGKLGSGFWIVAIIGATVIWYNDIEDGFNRSRYTSFGTIDEYWCNQDELEMALQYVLNFIETGQETGPRIGSPMLGKWSR
ncbi:hypothetical protein [Collimonas sp. OK412]|jgi:hypothetical protein|uniref:hypothetical protein n=1 Tax=Collimonas sp. (strain OK412) TaxID=1801619 RepID=UPI0008E3ED90|nr:hypothetical protein [Collimonas sp. OK412]SFB84748.1 hypothetical protein SAMN04515619_102221 [Collimonas sp. OK412]